MAELKKCPKCDKMIAGAKPGAFTALLFPLGECRCDTNSLRLGRSKALRTTPAKLETDPYLGKTVSNFEIVEMIGSGGMGSVYRGVDKESQTEYALKFINASLLEQTQLVLRLEHEAKAAKDLTHANIVPVYGVGKSAEDVPFLIMGYVRGESLDDVLNKEGALKSERATNIFIQVADALCHAHEKGIVHRDLKPSNILLTKKDKVDDFVKIVDFGIAKIMDEYSADKTKLTQTGELVGSPLYMSPEQCRGDELDARSDLYSLGCLMYETISGKAPFEADNPVRVILKHLSDEPARFSQNLGLNRQLAKVILRCLEKDPKDRYQSAQQLVSDLENVRDSKPVSRQKIKWNKPQIRNAAAVVALLAAGALIAGYFHSGTLPAVAPRHEHRAEEYDGKNLLQWTDAIEASPSNARLYFERGMLHSMRDERTNAIDDFSQAIELKPAYTQAYIERAFVYMMVANYDAALADADEALSLKPDLADAYEVRGSVYAATEQYQESIADFQKVISINSSPNAALMLGRSYLKLAQYDNAEAALKQAADAWRGDMNYVYSIVGLMHVFKADYSGAEKYFRGLKVDTDTIAFNWGQYAYYFVAIGNIPEAEKAIAQMKALETFPARSFRLAGEVYRTAGMCDKAIKEFSAGTSLEEYPPGYRERAVTYIALGQLHSAKTDLDRSLSLNRYSSITLSYLALVESRLGMAARAAEHITECFAVSKEQPPIVYANKARVELDIGDSTDALADANTALSKDPWLKEGYEVRALIYGQLKNTAAANADTAKASKLLSHLDL